MNPEGHAGQGVRRLMMPMMPVVPAKQKRRDEHQHEERVHGVLLMDPPPSVKAGDNLKVEVRVVVLELKWISRRVDILMYRGVARDEAIDQAVDEQMAMEEFDLDKEVKGYIRLKRS